LQVRKMNGREKGRREDGKIERWKDGKMKE
jgi:hypothetical protein